MRTELNGGAWCPQTPATPDLKEWLQIDLHAVHMITATETQGRFGNGQGVEYTEAYMIEYWRPRLLKWIRYRDHQGNEVIKGNMNTYIESKTELDPPIWASKIRFLPFSYHRRTVCMRVEAYGCPWTTGIVSYSMPQGDKRGSSWEFYDTSYDGHWDGKKLKYGLGQLTDGKVAPDDFKQMFDDRDNSQGWVGWKNDSRGDKPVEIVFEFDAVREFTGVHIFANNQFSKEVQVFAKAKVYFSIGGRHYKGEPITYDYIEDCIFETPRNVSIKLHHRVGRFVKLQLYFAARWLLLSEVTFDSAVVSGNFTEEEGELDNEIDGTSNKVQNTGAQNNNVVSALNTPSGIGQYLGVGVGLLTVLALLMIGAVVFMVIQQRRYKSSPRPSQIPNPCDKTALYSDPKIHQAPSEYSDDRSNEYAIPLQPPQSPRAPPPLQSIFPKPPPVPPPPESYYAATEICNNGFIPPPPPLSTPPPTRFTRQPRYVANTKTYIGP